MVSNEVIKQCQQKQQTAFKAMYEACVPYVFTIVKDYTSNKDIQKDLLQEIFAKLFLNIQSFDPNRGEFKFWLRKIAVNQCLMFVRDKKQEFEDLENNTVLNGLNEEMDLSHLDPALTEKVLTQMPQGYRQVFSLVALEGYSHHEVGQELGISAETSRSQFMRARQWLMQHFVANNSISL
ncbi:MAG: sigma-70 family RNA polymerase sigma factor [Saprospiraceae bacterium]|nr:sigma-70 family RNA polymerase sigma factor [Saprospiraceae bacterium]